MSPGELCGDGRYEVIRSLRSGGMGAVYEARDRRLANTPCALKEILEARLQGSDAKYMRERFEAEMQVLANLEHPGIPRVRDYFSHESSFFIVMDYIQGTSLDEELAHTLSVTGQPLEPEVVADDALQILDILAYLHARKLVHRDIKPANILRDAATGKLKLVDFGLARSVEGGESQTMVGTPAYCPKEQMSGRAEPRSDLYALGVTMHHLATGKPPRVFELLPLHASMPDYRPALAAIIERATAPQAADRYPNAQAMAADLRAFLKQPEPEVVAVAAPLPQPAPASTRAAFYLALAGAVVFGLVLGQWRPTPVVISTPLSASPMEVVLATPAPTPTPKPIAYPAFTPPPRPHYDLRPTSKPERAPLRAVLHPRSDNKQAYPGHAPGPRLASQPLDVPDVGFSDNRGAPRVSLADQSQIQVRPPAEFAAEGSAAIALRSGPFRAQATAFRIDNVTQARQAMAFIQQNPDVFTAGTPFEGIPLGPPSWLRPNEVCFHMASPSTVGGIVLKFFQPPGHPSCFVLRVSLEGRSGSRLAGPWQQAAAAAFPWPPPGH